MKIVQKAKSVVAQVAEKVAPKTPAKEKAPVAAPVAVEQKKAVSKVKTLPPKKAAEVPAPVAAPVAEEKPKKTLGSKVTAQVAEPPKPVAPPEPPKKAHPVDMPDELESEEGDYAEMDVSLADLRKAFYAEPTRGFPFRLLANENPDEEYVEMLILFVDKEGVVLLDTNTRVREVVTLTAAEVNARVSNGIPFQLYKYTPKAKKK